MAAFCIPAAIMCAVIVYRGIYPFGEQCFLRVDLYNQYLPFFMELQRKLKEGGSLFFSWRAGLGADFLSLYAYYLASPMNWLLVFCPDDLVIEFMTLLIVIKIGLCGTSFAWYLKKHFHNDGYETALFSVFYALSGYLCAYNWNIMWLDCVILAPVVIAGLEQLTVRKKSGLYIISLSACMLTNYYISMPLCFFLFLYELVLSGSMPVKNRLKRFGQFVFASALSAAMAAVLLFPVVFSLRSSGFSHTAFPSKIKFYFNILGVLARHCMNVSPELRSGHWPNLYCGTAVFFLLPLYVCSRKIAWKEKLGKIFLLAFLYLSFSVNVLDFFWHGMNYPNSLPARQSFLLVFLVLVCCFEVFVRREEFSGRQIIVSAGGAFLFLCFVSRFADQEDFQDRSIAFTMLYMTISVFLFFGYRNGALKKRAAGILFTVFVICEAALNTETTSVALTNRTEYVQAYQTMQALTEGLDEKDPVRIEEKRRMTKNDGMLGGFSSATYFSSTVNRDMGRFYERLGMSSSKVFYSYDGAMPLTSALLSVGYTISDQEEESEEFYEKIKEENGSFLYRNRYVLPFGFGIDTKCMQRIEKIWQAKGMLPYEVNNALAEALGIREKLFERIPVRKLEDELLTEADQDGYFYAYPLSCSRKNMTAETFEKETVFQKVYYPRFLELGFCRKGSRIILKENGEVKYAGADFEAEVYRMDVSVLSRIIRLLGRSPMEILERNDTYIKGRINMEEDGMLATSIPWEAGWHLRIDGKKAEITPFGEVMLGALLEKGSHEIEFYYTPPGLYAGAVVSGIGVILFVLLLIRERRSSRFIRMVSGIGKAAEGAEPEQGDRQHHGVGIAELVVDRSGKEQGCHNGGIGQKDDEHLFSAKQPCGGSQHQTKP